MTWSRLSGSRGLGRSGFRLIPESHCLRLFTWIHVYIDIYVHLQCPVKVRHTTEAIAIITHSNVLLGAVWGHKGSFMPLSFCKPFPTQKEFKAIGSVVLASHLKGCCHHWVIGKFVVQATACTSWWPEMFSWLLAAWLLSLPVSSLRSVLAWKPLSGGHFNSSRLVTTVLSSTIA